MVRKETRDGPNHDHAQNKHDSTSCALAQRFSCTNVFLMRLQDQVDCGRTDKETKSKRLKEEKMT